MCLNCSWSWVVWNRLILVILYLFSYSFVRSFPLILGFYFHLFVFFYLVFMFSDYGICRRTESGAFTLQDDSLWSQILNLEICWKKREEGWPLFLQQQRLSLPRFPEPLRKAANL